jgi:outer membrane lipoprotein carrier protein
MNKPLHDWLRTPAALLAAVAMAAAALPARAAEGTDALRRFVQEVKSARAAFTQTVTSPDGAKKKSSTGSFEFSRPGRFRFDYAKPYEQTIVGDGRQVWLYDPDLNQVTVRPFDKAVGSTPAALLAGGSLERDFDLKDDAREADLLWVLATPKASEGQSIRSMRVGLRGNQLAALEIVDTFGQRSRLDFRAFDANGSVAAERFTFTPPQGADVLKP